MNDRSSLLVSDLTMQEQEQTNSHCYYHYYIYIRILTDDNNNYYYRHLQLRVTLTSQFWRRQQFSPRTAFQSLDERIVASPSRILWKERNKHKTSMLVCQDKFRITFRLRRALSNFLLPAIKRLIFRAYKLLFFCSHNDCSIFQKKEERRFCRPPSSLHRE